MSDCWAAVRLTDCACGGLVVLGGVEILLVVEDLEADVERPVAHVGLREAEEELAAHVAQVALQAEGFTQAEEVVGLVVNAEEGARKAADAAIEADGVLALFLHLEEQVDGAGFGILMGLGVLVDLEGLEVLQLVEAEQAVLPQLGVVDLAFFEQQLAADDAVAGDGVALKLNARDVEGLAFVDVDVERDRLLLVVVGEFGDGAEVDVAQLAIGLFQVVQALADQSGVEPVAILDGKGGAQGFDVGDGLVAGEGDGAEPVAAAFFNGHAECRCACRGSGRKVNQFRPPSSRICVFGSSTAALA